MLKSEVQIGATYRLKHTSGYIEARILRAVERHGYGENRRTLTHWIALNLKTKREIEIKSAAKLLRLVNPA